MSTPLPPLVSIIIPCFRQGRYLAETVRAALAQSYPRLEILVVNDGSDDDTEAVAKGFGTRIVYLPKANGGLASARNAGIRRATGEYLYFLDADDLLPPWSIQWLVEAAEAGGRCIAMMGYRTFVVPGEFHRGEAAPMADSLFPWLLLRNYPVHCYLIPRSLAIAVNGFDETMPTHEDHEFWVRVAAVDARMTNSLDRGAYYRQHPGSMSRGTLRMGIGRLRLLKKTTEVVVNNPAIAGKYGQHFLRHLYVSRLIFTAQTPDLDRTELDRCIVRMHRADVGTKRGIFDWCYTLVPQPLRNFADRVAVALLAWLAPRKYRELSGLTINPAGRLPSSR